MNSAIIPQIIGLLFWTLLTVYVYIRATTNAQRIVIGIIALIAISLGIYNAYTTNEFFSNYKHIGEQCETLASQACQNNKDYNTCYNNTMSLCHSAKKDPNGF